MAQTDNKVRTDQQQVDIALEEWKTLRAETLQSQNQRITAFQISIALFSALYAVYLAPQADLTENPIVFQALLVLVLTPFVRIISGLRERDYLQACYIGNFTQLRVGDLRYTQRQNAVPRTIRDRASSTKQIQWTYILLVLFTTLLTLLYGLLSSGTVIADRYAVMDAGSVLDLSCRLLLLVAALGAFFRVWWRGNLSEGRRNEIFESVRCIAVRELLDGTLQPQGWTENQKDDPAAWEKLFATESGDNKRIVLEALKKSGRADTIAVYLEAAWLNSSE